MARITSNTRGVMGEMVITIIMSINVSDWIIMGGHLATEVVGWAEVGTLTASSVGTAPRLQSRPRTT